MLLKLIIKCLQLLHKRQNKVRNISKPLHFLPDPDAKVPKLLALPAELAATPEPELLEERLVEVPRGVRLKRLPVSEGHLLVYLNFIRRHHEDVIVQKISCRVRHARVVYERGLNGQGLAGVLLEFCSKEEVIDLERVVEG